MNSQTQKIKELLADGRWHCTSEMYAMFMADPRRRLCDLRDRGNILEGQRCKLHNYHKGSSKMWRLVAVPSLMPQAVHIEIKPKQEKLFALAGFYHNYHN